MVLEVPIGVGQALSFLKRTSLSICFSNSSSRSFGDPSLAPRQFLEIIALVLDVEPLVQLVVNLPRPVLPPHANVPFAISEQVSRPFVVPRLDEVPLIHALSGLLFDVLQEPAQPLPFAEPAVSDLPDRKANFLPFSVRTPISTSFLGALRAPAVPRHHGKSLRGSRRLVQLSAFFNYPVDFRNSSAAFAAFAAFYLRTARNGEKAKPATWCPMASVSLEASTLRKLPIASGPHSLTVVTRDTCLDQSGS